MKIYIYEKKYMYLEIYYCPMADPLAWNLLEGTFRMGSFQSAAELIIDRVTLSKLWRTLQSQSSSFDSVGIVRLEKNISFELPCNNFHLR